MDDMYTLGNITLPYPKSLTRKFIELSASNLLIEGVTTRRVQNRKEQFILEFQYLTQAQVNSILSEFELGSIRSFTVTEDNLSIAATDVLIDIAKRDYPQSADQFRENLTLVLTEVI